MDSFASGVLLFLGLIVFGNYKNGTLGDWTKAKFLNTGAPADSSSPFSAGGGDGGGGGSSFGAQSTDGASSPVAGRLSSGSGGLGALLAPVTGVITGIFGEQRATHKHAGIDYAVPIGTAVRAARGGKISLAGNQSGYGLTVQIDHGGGSVTKYAHLSEIKVRVGDTVSAGTVVALSGNTGNSTGPHVHFELVNNGVPVDPAGYLSPVASVGAALSA